MNELNTCFICGKSIDKGLKLCEECEEEIDIKQFELQIEM